MLGRARSEDKEEIATNLPPLHSRRRKNKTWKVHWVCVSKRKLMGQNLHWSTAEFRVRVFSPTSSGQNRWLPVTRTGFLGREGGISNVWKNAGKKLKHSYQKLKHSSNWVGPLKWWVYNITVRKSLWIQWSICKPRNCEILPIDTLRLQLSLYVLYWMGYMEVSSLLPRLFALIFVSPPLCTVQ